MELNQSFSFLLHNFFGFTVRPGIIVVGNDCVSLEFLNFLLHILKEDAFLKGFLFFVELSISAIDSQDKGFANLSVMIRVKRKRVGFFLNQVVTTFL